MKIIAWADDGTHVRSGANDASCSRRICTPETKAAMPAGVAAAFSIPLGVIEQPRPMHTAPRDGTVILAFIDGTNYAQPVRWTINKPMGLSVGGLMWRMAWDDYPVRESDLLGWLPVPVYSGPPVR